MFIVNKDIGQHISCDSIYKFYTFIYSSISLYLFLKGYIETINSGCLWRGVSMRIVLLLFIFNSIFLLFFVLSCVCINLLLRQSMCLK